MITLKKKPTAEIKKNRRNAYIFCCLWLVLTLVIFKLEDNPSENTTIYTQETTDNRMDFYELDEIIEKTEPGTQLIDYSDFNDFAIGTFTLEGAISKYGIPTNVTGADEGNDYIEVCFPTDESGYSADLVFKRMKSNFGDWVLDKKNVVETSGIGFSKYTSP